MRRGRHSRPRRHKRPAANYEAPQSSPLNIPDQSRGYLVRGTILYSRDRSLSKGPATRHDSLVSVLVVFLSSVRVKWSPTEHVRHLL